MAHRGINSAVVAGAGVAGILCARVVADAGLEVVLIDTDLPSAGRTGVPHRDQLHNVLTRGQASVREILSQVESRLTAQGLVRADVSRDTRVLELGTLMPRRPLGREIWSISRGSFGAALHDAAGFRGRLVQGRVLGMEYEGSTVTGVRVLDAAGGEGVIHGDLVIDCRGDRGSSSQIAGLSADRLSTRQWYASADIELEAGDPATTEFCLTFPHREVTRGGLMSPSSSRGAKVSLNGIPADPIPRTAAEFTDFAASLEDPTIARALKRSRRISAPRVFQKPTAVWWRYDRHDACHGLLAVGDRSASLNPLFGQGLSGAAWEAAQLGRALREQDTVTGVTHDYRRRSGILRGAMWRLMTVFSPKSTARLDDAGYRSLVRHLRADPGIHRDYVDVWHLMKPVDSIRQLAAGQRFDWDRLSRDEKDVWL